MDSLVSMKLVAEVVVFMFGFSAVVESTVTADWQFAVSLQQMRSCWSSRYRGVLHESILASCFSVVECTRLNLLNNVQNAVSSNFCIGIENCLIA